MTPKEAGGQQRASGSQPRTSHQGHEQTHRKGTFGLASTVEQTAAQANVPERARNYGHDWEQRMGKEPRNDSNFHCSRLAILETVVGDKLEAVRPNVAAGWAVEERV
jgi:hypothetical protein